MYRSLLQFFSQFRIPLLWARRSKLTVGQTDVLDALGSTQWREFLDAEKLFDTWAPVTGDHWQAFHCATLFASIDWIAKDHLGSAPDHLFFDFGDDGMLGGMQGWMLERVPVPRWIGADSWLILDGPGWISVAVAARLVEHQACQTVCTFDNWPHALGLVKPEMTLAALIRYAPLMAIARRNLLAGLPPVWVCDNTRLGTRTGRPKEFDNRYFLDDSILPGAELLKTHGIGRVIYASPTIQAPPTADLIPYLEYLKKQGISVQRISMSSVETWKSEPVPLESISPLPLNKGSFFRSTSGGFGAAIPEPSSSSG